SVPAPPVSRSRRRTRTCGSSSSSRSRPAASMDGAVTPRMARDCCGSAATIDRKSTRLNSSHVKNSYAVFCLKKKRVLLLQARDGLVPRQRHQPHECASLRRTDDRQLIVGDAARLLQHLVQQLGGADELLHVVHVPERLVTPLHDAVLALAHVHDVHLLLLVLAQPVTALRDVTNALLRLFCIHAAATPEIYTLSLHDALPI